ncbi:MAG: hypothetical protein KAR19_03675 [Bacteroidales bacterium]|nr:hypothetical protein [Bacteroidales bacterium]
MYITVDMVFSKEYIRRFAFSLSINDKALEFRKRDKLNTLIRSYLEISRKDHKPKFGSDITKIILPINGRWRCNPAMEILPARSFRDLESDFEDLFFALFHKIDSAGCLVKGKRKYAREKYLAACNITNEELHEDAFRKLFDRFRNKKEAQISAFLENPDFDLVTFYESGIKNFIHSDPENVQLLS